MKPESIIITPPEGYEIDEENSTLREIKFKPKKLTYKGVAKALFTGKTVYYPALHFGVGHTKIDGPDDMFIADPNNAGSEKQVEKLLALNELINVAKYLNGDWKPDYNDDKQFKYFISYYKNTTNIEEWCCYNMGTPCFKSEELANQAIEILGEETIKLALSQV